MEREHFQRNRLQHLPWRQLRRTLFPDQLHLDSATSYIDTTVVAGNTYFM